MARLNNVTCTAVGIVLAGLLANCQWGEPRPEPPTTGRSAVAPTARVPSSVARLAVLYPRTSDREMAAAYLRLAGATFLLKRQRPALQIIERSDLPAILDEHRFEAGGLVSDQTAVHLGRFLGVDGILLYRIEGPNLRDRIFAKYSGDLPPFLVTSKIILVESAEVVFHNVVVARVEGSDPTQPLIRAALDRGVDRTAADLWEAFR